MTLSDELEQQDKSYEVISSRVDDALHTIGAGQTGDPLPAQPSTGDPIPSFPATYWPQPYVSFTTKNLGWECPRCARCYAPHITKCDHCGPAYFWPGNTCSNLSL